MDHDRQRALTSDGRGIATIGLGLFTTMRGPGRLVIHCPQCMDSKPLLASKSTSTSLPKDDTDPSSGKLVALVRAHHTMLARFFGRHAPDKSEVPDLVQDVFLKLSKSEVPTELVNSGNYVTSVARSVLVDHHRRRQVRHVNDHAELSDYALQSTDLPIERVLDSKAMAGRLQAALLELPERTRDVFALRTLRDMKMAEVAETMQISLSTAEKHHARARAHLAVR